MVKGREGGFEIGWIYLFNRLGEAILEGFQIIDRSSGLDVMVFPSAEVLVSLCFYPFLRFDYFKKVLDQIKTSSTNNLRVVPTSEFKVKYIICNIH